MLLVWVTLQPFRWPSRDRGVEPPTAAGAPQPVYRRILVTLDHTRLDRQAIAHAAALAVAHRAEIYLLHVEEGVTSQVYGAAAETAEVTAGRQYLEATARSLEQSGIQVTSAISHSPNPRREIVRYARTIRPDLIIMGAHGHRRLKDLIFGTTIDPVRHQLNVPILVVREN
jgi:manganese transport protein